jgi:predicted AlkP superfamily pyrophosphatase or phosphodiesterase
VVPHYGDDCLSSVVPALMARAGGIPSWMPSPVADARQVVLLVLDGFGWEYLAGAGRGLPALASGTGGPITSVAPSTTATALTSLATGAVPAVHGVLGYRLTVDGVKGHHSPEVMNVLRWRSESGDLRRRIPAGAFQRVPAFGDRTVPVVTRREFASTGFSAAHLGGSRIIGWSVPSTLVVETRRLLRKGETFVYVYYDGLDKVAHAYGLGEHYEAELAAVDRLVADLLDTLVPGSALVLTSDHGQVEVTEPARLPNPALLAATALFSGEGRFRWIHARPGANDDLLAAARESHGHEAWVLTREELVESGWFGGPLEDEVESRLGDVALVAHAPVAFLDPADTGETRLLARHGSLTSAEMWVPLLAWSPS